MTCHERTRLSFDCRVLSCNSFHAILAEWGFSVVDLTRGGVQVRAVPDGTADVIEGSPHRTMNMTSTYRPFCVKPVQHVAYVLMQAGNSKSSVPTHVLSVSEGAIRTVSQAPMQNGKLSNLIKYVRMV